MRWDLEVGSVAARLPRNTADPRPIHGAHPLLSGLEAGRPGQVPATVCLAEECSWLSASICGWRAGSSTGPFNKGTSPVRGPHPQDLLTSYRPHLLMPSLRVTSQHVDLRGTHVQPRTGGGLIGFHLKVSL